MKTNLDSLLISAIENNVLKDILIGIPPYQYDTKYSCSKTGHDIMSVLEVINTLNDKNVLDKLGNTLIGISNDYEGVIPCLSVLLFIEIRKRDQMNNFIIDTNTILENMSKTIKEHKYNYICDITGDGSGFDDEKYGEIKRIISLLNSDFNMNINIL